MLDNRVFIINRSELEDRFDPIFYASDLTKFNTNIFKSVLLKSIVKYFKSGFGAGKQEQTDAKNGIIQIRPTNIDENGFLKYDKNIYLPIDKNSIRIEVDDIIFNNTNSQELVGKTAILKENKELTFSNHITIIRVRKEAILPDYLWIILNIYQRNRIFYSICTNWNNQSGIGLEVLKKLKIPLPPLEIQQQIVDLYEKAYTEKQQKEAEAQRLLDSIDDYLLGELGITLPKEDEYLPQNTGKNNIYNLDNDNPLVKKGRLFLTNLSEVTGKRIDPDYNSKYFYCLFQSLNNSIYPFERIKKYLKAIKTGTTPNQKLNAFTTEKEIPFLRNTNLKKYEINIENTKYIRTKYKDFLTFSYKDEVIMCIAGTIGISSVNIYDIPISINQNVSSLRFSEEINPFFISYWFNTNIFLSLAKRASSVATILYLNNDNLKSLPIPIPPLQKQSEIATHISQIRNKANILKQEGKEILEQAKQEVEQMILGN